MRTKIVAGNWKMNKNFQEGLELTSEITGMVKDEINGNVEVVLIPTYIHLNSVTQLAKGIDKVSTGAQNCHIENAGAYTGEISAGMVAAAGCKYCLAGHSERRMYNGETNAILAKKVDAILANHLHPIYCCGETIEERNAGKHFEVIGSQVKEGLFHLSADQILKCVIAYEPVWAIGTGVVATTEQAQEVHAFIRSILSEQYGTDIASQIRILYGGSVKPDNAKELFSQADIDGGLVGGASLQSRSFVDIVKGAI